MTLDVLPDCARKFLRRHRGQEINLLITQFYQWMNEHHIGLKTLQQVHIDNFLASGLAAHQKISLHRYLTELAIEGRIAYDPTTAGRKLSQPLITDYFDSKPTNAHRCVVKIFHRWLRSQGIQISSFRIEHIEKFLSNPKKKSLGAATKRIYRREIYKYLEYLVERKALSITAEELNRFIEKPAPQLLEQFLCELKISRQQATIKGYRTNLRSFYSYIDRQQLTLCSIGRDDIIQWFRMLKEKELHPSTRYHHVVHLRVYFHWLYSQNAIETHPSKLVLRGDFPKLPTYLPRPLSPDVDRALQQFLARRRHIAAKGLLLMRKTGIRIGELRSLDYDCSRTDLHGNTFLKVPLGKLHNERLVPLHSSTVELLNEIKLRKPTQRRYLIATIKTKKLHLSDLTQLLERASKKQNLTQKIVSHQLRHTCATEILNAGMSLASVMKFLGHRDIRMTLRYANVTQETIVREFQTAIAQTETRYQLESTAENQEDLSPDTLVAGIIKYLQKYAIADSKNTARLIKRLYKLKIELSKVKLSSGQRGRRKVTG